MYKIWYELIISKTIDYWHNVFLKEATRIISVVFSFT